MFLNVFNAMFNYVNSKFTLFSKLFLFFALALVFVVLFKNFFFGEKVLMFLDKGNDTFYVYYRSYYYLIEHIRNLELPAWSFQIGAGTNVVRMFSRLYDPFSIVYLVVGENNIASSLVYVFTLKALCSALFMYLFLSYIQLSRFAVITGSLLYAFNGYLMLWGQHYQFANVVVFLPLFLLSLERWHDEGRNFLLVMSIVLMSLHLYFYYQFLVFFIFYYLFWFYTKYDFDLRIFSTLSVKLLVLFAISAGIAAPLILPEYYLLHTSPRVSIKGVSDAFSNPFYFASIDYYYSLFFSLFSNNLQGVGSYFLGYKNYYESTHLYAGLLFLVLFPQVCFLTDTKLKKVILVAVSLTAIFLVFPWFARLMNGFQVVTYRWLSYVVFLEILLLAFLINNICKGMKLNILTLVVTCVVLISSLVLANDSFSGYINHLNINNITIYGYSFLRITVIAFLIVVFAMLIYFYSLKKNKYVTALVGSLLLMAVMMDVMLEHYQSFNKRSLVSKGLEYNKNVDLFGYTIDVIKYLKDKDDSFYRVEKNRWILSLNDSFVQGYFGLDTYSSINTPSYYDFSREMDLRVDKRKSSVKILGWTSLQRPAMSDLVGVKYYLTKDVNVFPENVKYLKTIGDVSVFERLSVLPFGFTYNSYIPKNYFLCFMGDDLRDEAMLQGFIPPDTMSDNDLLKLTNLSDFRNWREDSRSILTENILHLDTFEEDYLRGNVALKVPKMLFLSIPDDSGWQASVNGERVEIHRINFGFIGLMLPEGDNVVELEYITPYLLLGLSLFALSFLMIGVFFVYNKNLKLKKLI